MRQAESERQCEPGRMSDRTVRRVYGGLAAFLLVTFGAVGAEIASGHGDSDATEPTEEILPEQLVLSENLVRDLVYQDRRRTAEYFAQRAQDSGEINDVIACDEAVKQLALVSIGPVRIDCTPPTTLTSHTP